MKILKCKRCGSEDIIVEIKTTVKYIINDEGMAETEGEGSELEMTGSPYCDNCGEDFGKITY